MVRSDQRRLVIDRLFNAPLSRPLRVELECISDGDFLASVPDLNMAMGGQSAGDAISALKEYVEMSIQSFRTERESLGPEPLTQLNALEAHIGGKHKP